MDPDANLKEQLEIAHEAYNHFDDGNDKDMDRLVELVIALDEWLAGGGFLPTRWQRPNDPKGGPEHG